MTALLDQAAVVEDEDAVHLANRRQAMGDDQRGALREQFLNALLDQGLGVASPRIKISGLCASARISASNCFSPTERFAPRSKIRVSSPCGKVAMRRSLRSEAFRLCLLPLIGLDEADARQIFLQRCRHMPILFLDREIARPNTPSKPHHDVPQEWEEGSGDEGELPTHQRHQHDGRAEEENHLGH
jgi:hypothetical protein